MDLVEYNHYRFSNIGPDAEEEVTHSEDSDWRVKVNFNVTSYMNKGVTGEIKLSQAEITLEMMRNPTFYMIYLVLPSILMGFVSVLVFLLPPESGEKVGLSITVLLSFTVLLLMASEVTPKGGSNLPHLSKF